MRYGIFSSSGNEILNIDSVGYSENPATTGFGPGKRNLYIIHYVISGRGYFNSHIVNRGQGFLIYPGMTEHYYPDEKEPWAFLWIISSDCRMKRLFEEYHAQSETNIFDYGTSSALMQTKDKIIKNNNKLYCGYEMLELFLHIFNSHTYVHDKKQNAADTYYTYAVNWIASNLFRPTRIEELTAFLGISQPYLYRIFMSKCGLSPKQYINQCKLKEAIRLLCEENMSVTETANSVGYGDVLAFSKFFRRMTGTPPSEFR